MVVNELIRRKACKALQAFYPIFREKLAILSIIDTSPRMPAGLILRVREELRRLLISADSSDQNCPDHYHDRISHPHAVGRQIPILGLFETEDEERVVGQQRRKET